MNKSIPPTAPSLLTQIARLPDLPMAEIRALWQKLVGSKTLIHNRQFLERRIAYRLQEIEFRKTDPNLLERNKRRINALIETGKTSKRDRHYNPPAGTVLTREYQGAEYRVIVLADKQYDFNGRLYPSLSMIAREITGTQWSGPLFFGLKPPTPRKPKNRKAKQGAADE